MRAAPWTVAGALLAAACGGSTGPAEAPEPDSAAVVIDEPAPVAACRAAHCVGADDACMAANCAVTAPTYDAGIRKVRQTLRKHRFDIVIDPQSLTKSALLGWLSGARTRIGFDRPQGRELSLYLNNLRITPQQSHVVDRYRELLAPVIGSSLPAVQFQLPKRQLKTAIELIDQAGGPQHFAVLNPGAGWQSKTWLPRSGA